MNNLGISKKTWEVILGITIAIIAVLVLFFVYKKDKNTEKLLEVTTSQLSPSETPAGLPKNLPIEKGTTVLQNYQSITNDGRLQSTKQITSFKQPKEALDTYIDFFNKLGWVGGYSESASIIDGQQTAQMKDKTGSLLIVSRPVSAGKTTVEFTLIQNQ